MRTSLYSILCIVVRLGAVFLAATVVIDVPTAIGEAINSQYSFPPYAMLAFGAAELVLAALLWLYPGILARVATKDSSRQIFESPLMASDIQTIAFSVLGMSFALTGFVSLVAIGLRVVMIFEVGEDLGRYLHLYGWPSAGREIIRIVLGGGLVFGSAGLTGWLRTIRERGLPPAVSDADA